MLFNQVIAIWSPDQYVENYTKRDCHGASANFSLDNYIAHYEQKILEGTCSGYKLWWYQINGETKTIHLMDQADRVQLKKPIRYLNKSSETV
jgi:hypothetical protein